MFYWYKKGEILFNVSTIIIANNKIYMYLSKWLQERIILRCVNIEHILVKKFKENDRSIWFLVSLMCLTTKTVGVHGFAMILAESCNSYVYRGRPQIGPIDIPSQLFASVNLIKRRRQEKQAREESHARPLTWWINKQALSSWSTCPGTHLAYAFSRRAGQNWSLWRLCTKASRPWIAGSLSSTRTSTHAPHHHNRNLKTPAYSAVGDPGGSPLFPNPWSAGTTL